MRTLLLSLVLALTSCRPARDEVVFQACLASAELDANREASARCIDADLGWDSCPYRGEVMATLAKAQEACRGH